MKEVETLPIGYVLCIIYKSNALKRTGRFAGYVVSEPAVGVRQVNRVDRRSSWSIKLKTGKESDGFHPDLYWE